MAPRQDPDPFGPRRPAKDPHRTAAFREAARAIVHKDCYDRRAGYSVDTPGAIARAMERAYAQDFADVQVPAPLASAPSEAEITSNRSAGPVE